MRGHDYSLLYHYLSNHMNKAMIQTFLFLLLTLSILLSFSLQFVCAR